MASPLLQKIEILLGKTTSTTTTNKDEHNDSHPHSTNEELQMPQDDDDNNNNTDDKLSPQSLYRNERLLIAMILLQRIPVDTRLLSPQKYKTLLLDTELLSFCERLLNHLMVDMKSDKDNTIHPNTADATRSNNDCWTNYNSTKEGTGHNTNVLIRWIVQFYSQCVVGLSTTLIIHNNNNRNKEESFSTNHHHRKQFHHIWESLWKVLEFRVTHSRWEEADLDVMHALQDCLEVSSALYNNRDDSQDDHSRTLLLHHQTLLGLWKRFQHMATIATIDTTTATTTTSTTTTTTTTPTASTSTKTSSPGTTRSSNTNIMEQQHKQSNQDFQQMMETLEALLVEPKSSSLQQQQQQEELENDANALIQKVMTQHTMTIYPLHTTTMHSDGTAAFPLWFTRMLSFVTDATTTTTDSSSVDSIASSSSSVWPQEVLLRSFQQLIHHHSNNDNGSKEYLKEWILSTMTKKKNEIACLYNLLLMYITSSHNAQNKEDQDNIQIVAWDILVTLIDSCGWQWMMMLDNHEINMTTATKTKLVSTSTTAGSEQLAGQPASNFCMILRLATGEFRIRLGLLLEQLQDDKEEEKDAENIETRLFVLESCGRLATAGLEYVIQLADTAAEDESSTVETTPLPIPADALLHIRQSLRDILDATMQYFLIDECIPQGSSSSSSHNGLSKEENERRPNKSHHIHKVHELVCRIFGTVLTEFIPDLMLSSSSSPSSSSEQLHQQQEDTLSSTLQAIHAVLLLIQFLNQQQQQPQDTDSNSTTSMGNSSSPSSIRMISYVLPCLTTIYTNIDRKTLDENQLLGAHDKNNVILDVLSSHLATCLQKARNNNEKTQDNDDPSDDLDIFSSVSWTFHVIEAWCDVANPTNSVRRSLVEPLLNWISDLVSVIHETNGTTLLSQKGPSSEVLSLLNIVLGCYMTLLGESIVDSESERRLIERALHCLSSSTASDA